MTSIYSLFLSSRQIDWRHFSDFFFYVVKFQYIKYISECYEDRAHKPCSQPVQSFDVEPSFLTSFKYECYHLISVPNSSNGFCMDLYRAIELAWNGVPIQIATKLLKIRWPLFVIFFRLRKTLDDLGQIFQRNCNFQSSFSSVLGWSRKGDRMQVRVRLLLQVWAGRTQTLLMRACRKMGHEEFHRFWKCELDHCQHEDVSKMSRL